MSPMSPQKSHSGGRNLTGPHSINHRGGGTAWCGFGTGLVHPETTIITNGYRVWYTGTPWRPYEGVPHPKPVSAAFVAPVTPPMPFENPVLSASFRAFPWQKIFPHALSVISANSCSTPSGKCSVFVCFLCVSWQSITNFPNLSASNRTVPNLSEP